MRRGPEVPLSVVEDAIAARQQDCFKIAEADVVCNTKDAMGTLGTVVVVRHSFFVKLI